MPNDRRKEVRSVQQESAREERIFTFKVTKLIWLLLGSLEALIALRIGLKLISANPASPIVAFIYGFTHLLQPHVQSFNGHRYFQQKHTVLTSYLLAAVSIDLRAKFNAGQGRAGLLPKPAGWDGEGW